MGCIQGVIGTLIQVGGSMKQTAFWKKKRPKGEPSTPLTAAQKARAKARAAAAGRPYPNLVDNAAVAREAKRG